MLKILYVTISTYTKTKSTDCIKSETRKTCFKTKHREQIRCHNLKNFLP